MKKVIVISLCFLTLGLNAQCILDLGADVSACNGFSTFDSASVGNGLQITNGTAPYTYVWEARYEINIGSFQLVMFASDFLNDTTIANPKITGSIDSLTLKCTVTDSLGQTCTDSLNVYFSNFVSHLGSWGATINQGDSVYISFGSNVAGGYGSLQYLWQPNHGLTDSTNNFLGWVKPDSSTSYYVTVTDTSGCAQTGAPFIFVTVNPLSIQESFIAKNVSVYPNPATNILFLKNKSNTVLMAVLTQLNGKVLKEEWVTVGLTSWDVSAFAEGLYILTLTKDGEVPFSQKVMVRH